MLTEPRRDSAAAVLAGIVLAIVCGVNVIQAQTASAKIDQIGNVNAEDAMARLDRFALELQSHPELRGIIVASNTVSRNVPRGTFLRMANGYLVYLIHARGVEADRVSLVEGERKSESRFELWTLPRNELSTISEEASAAEPAQPELFDKIIIGPESQCVGDMPIELFKLEDGLRILGEALKQHSRARVWIVVHPRSRDSRSATQSLVNKSRQQLTKNGIRPDRILTAISNPRSSVCGAANIWIVPADSTKADEAGYYSGLMNEAEAKEYTVRRVEFFGNKRIRDQMLRKQFVQQEGDVFSRKQLEQSLRNFSRVRAIYPVAIDDVEVRLDREEKLIDITIGFRERGR